jgi:uncharacterized membrane protein YkoI
MTRRAKGIILAAGVIAASSAGGVAIAGGGDDEEDARPDRPITGSALDRAKAAALEHTGEGRVSETEVGDEEGYYEVEVTLGDGSQVDVHLDRGFHVLGQESDGRERGDD